MRRLWMLLLELRELLLHVLVVSAWRPLDFLGNFLATLSGLSSTGFNLLGAAFHFLDSLKEPNDFFNVQEDHLSYLRQSIELQLP